MFRFSFEPHPDEWTRSAQRATDRLMRRLPKVGESLGRVMVSHQQDEAPKDTGAFAGAHGHEVQRLPNGVRITAGAGVGGRRMRGRIGPQQLAQIVVGGSRPHLIEGNPLLAFYWEKAGKFMILPSVNHPGTAPNDYLARAERQYKPRAERAFRRLAEQWIEDIER